MNKRISADGGGASIEATLAEAGTSMMLVAEFGGLTRLART